VVYETLRNEGRRAARSGRIWTTQKRRISWTKKKVHAFGKQPYAELVALVGEYEHSDIHGPSGTIYQIELQVLWDAKPNGAIRVVASMILLSTAPAEPIQVSDKLRKLINPGWRHFQPRFTMGLEPVLRMLN
jgi:hypothetical protein